MMLEAFGEISKEHALITGHTRSPYVQERLFAGPKQPLKTGEFVLFQKIILATPLYRKSSLTEKAFLFAMASFNVEAV